MIRAGPLELVYKRSQARQSVVVAVVRMGPLLMLAGKSAQGVASWTGLHHPILVALTLVRRLALGLHAPPDEGLSAFATPRGPMSHALPGT